MNTIKACHHIVAQMAQGKYFIGDNVNKVWGFSFIFYFTLYPRV